MQLNVLTIRWERESGDSPRVTYFVDDRAVGADDAGFDKILEIVGSKRGITVVLKITRVPSLGGESLMNSLPFKDRFAELKDTIGENKNKLVYEFF